MNDFPASFPPVAGLVTDPALANRVDDGAGETPPEWFAADGENRLPLRVEAARTNDVDELVGRVLAHVVG